MCARAESGRMLRGAVAVLAEAVEKLAPPAPPKRPVPPEPRREKFLSGGGGVF